MDFANPAISGRPLTRVVAEMTRHEIEEGLTANVGRRVRITLDDGVTQIVEIGPVDDHAVS